MSAFARYTVEKFCSLEHRDGWTFNQVGGLEVATTPQRWADLHRKAGWAAAWGVEGRLLSRRRMRRSCIRSSTRPRPGRLPHPRTGWPRACAPPKRRPCGRSAAVPRSCRTPRWSESSRRAAGSPASRTADGVVDADIVVCAAGFWGAQLAKEVGLVVPLVPMAHQYARTGQIAALVGRNTELSEAGLPILRHQDQDLYFREHVDRIGIGYYGHEPMPVDMSTLMADTAGESMPSMLPFTEEDFAPAWRGIRTPSGAE